MRKAGPCMTGLFAALIYCSVTFAGDTVVVNPRTVTSKSGGGATAASPDVCKTPSPAGPVPVPYPNTATSRDTAQGSKKVKVDGNPTMIKDKAYFNKSEGDEAGTENPSQKQFQGYFKEMLQGASAGSVQQERPPRRIGGFVEPSDSAPSQAETALPEWTTFPRPSGEKLPGEHGPIPPGGRSRGVVGPLVPGDHLGGRMQDLMDRAGSRQDSLGDLGSSPKAWPTKENLQRHDMTPQKGKIFIEPQGPTPAGDTKK